MSDLQTDLDNLQASMAKGVKRAKIGQEEVEFRDFAEMRQVEAWLKHKIGQKLKSRLSYPQTSTGWR